MTDKPDYMQKARDMLGTDRHVTTVALIENLARTLEALDTERAAHEATKAEVMDYMVKWAEEGQRADKAEAELQALRVGLADRRVLNTLIARHFKPLVPDLPDLVLAGNRLCDDIQALIQPEPDPLVELAAMLNVAKEDALNVFDHTPEEIGLHVMENYEAVLAAIGGKHV